MALLGAAALAMWWDVAAAHRREFEDWHAHEHFPERLGLPGFKRGTRWSSVSREGGVFVLYELDDYATLTSPDYTARLNAPTPWSVAMMPHHRNMVRSQCRVLESAGNGVAGWLMSIRLTPAAGQAEALQATVRETLRALPTQPGLTSGHLLRTDTPLTPATTEQVIRGGDQAADWIMLVSGYDRDAVQAVSHGPLSPAALGIATMQIDTFHLAYALAQQDRP